MHIPKHLLDTLAERKAANALRSLTNTQEGVDFSSNDYLGFASDAMLLEKAHQFLSSQSFKNGATGSRLLTGNHRLYNEVEVQIAAYHQVASATIFNSGYDANLGFFSSVPQRGDIILYDAMIHASIRDGIALSKATSYKFPHHDLESLEKKLRHQKSQLPEDAEIYVVTESVFSMDGDSPDLEAICTICESHNALLIVDEAHAFGIFGDQGRGLLNALGLHHRVFASLVTYGKALGAHGAAILGPQVLKTYLINYARSLIYTTGLPPHSLATIKLGYETLATTTQQDTLHHLIQVFLNQIKTLGLESFFVPSCSAIQCCVLPGNDYVKQAAAFLQAKGFDVRPILYPTVPKGAERLRFCLHSNNSEKEIEEVLNLLATFVSS